MEYKEKLGLPSCIGIIVGGCIGSAIFSLSGQTIYYAGPGAIVSWIVAAVIQALYGMQVCELAVRYPQSGGIFVFPQKSFDSKTGDFWGFVSAWGYIVANFIAIAFSAITIGNFIGNGFNLTSNVLFTFCKIDFTWTIILALAGTLFCLFLNLMKITDAGRFNNFLVGILIAGMLIFAGFAFFGKRPDGSPTFTVSYFNNFFTQTEFGWRGTLKAIPVASVAYGSCVAISFMVGEVKNPNKTIPYSLLIGLAIVMILYIVMIIATIATCSNSLYTSMPFLQYCPQFGSILIDALVSYKWLAKLIACTALIALITTMIVLMALNARAIQAVAMSEYLPGKFASENRNGIPSFSTLICALVSCILCLKPDWTNTLVGLGALFSVISMVITCVALIVSRKKTTLEKNQYRCPGGIAAPLLTIISLGACYVIGSVSKEVIIFTAIIYAFGLAIFLIASIHKQKK